MSAVMTSPIYKFDESEFVARFIRDYYTETDFDLDSLGDLWKNGKNNLFVISLVFVFINKY